MEERSWHGKLFQVEGIMCKQATESVRNSVLLEPRILSRGAKDKANTVSKNLIPKEFMRMTYKLQISDFKRQRRVIARFSNHTQQVQRKGNCLLEIKGTRIFF